MGLWIAPGTEHTGFSHQEAVHCSAYIRRDLCSRMPDHSCAVMVSPLLRAILEHLWDLPAAESSQRSRARLLRVLVDQLSICATTGSFIPRRHRPGAGGSRRLKGGRRTQRWRS